MKKLLLAGFLAYLSGCALNLIKYDKTIQGPDVEADICALEQGAGYELVTDVNLYMVNKILRRTDHISWIPVQSEFIENNGDLELVIRGASDSLNVWWDSDSLYSNKYE